MTMPANESEGTPDTAVPPPTGLAVSVRNTDGSTAICTLAGDLDMETLAPAKQALDELVAAGVGRLVVDLGQVAFCDSSGLNLLLQVRMTAEAQGTRFFLAACAPSVQRVLELTGADAVFSVHPDAATALAAGW